MTLLDQPVDVSIRIGKDWAHYGIEKTKGSFLCGQSLSALRVHSICATVLRVPCCSACATSRLR